MVENMASKHVANTYITPIAHLETKYKNATQKLKQTGWFKISEAIPSFDLAIQNDPQLLNILSFHEWEWLYKWRECISSLGNGRRKTFFKKIIDAEDNKKRFKTANLDDLSFQNLIVEEAFKLIILRMKMAEFVSTLLYSFKI
jgi:hypothetical protein